MNEFVDDKKIEDQIVKPSRGGYRAGAGRKKGNTAPRKQPSWRVSAEAIEAIKLAAEASNHSAGDVLDWVMKNHKTIPENIK
mgnify:CR=1 FL=1